MKRFKKILAVMLSVVMLVGLMPFAVLAAESNYTAKIGGTTYAKLEDAIAAVKDGETIMLLADCAENVTITQKKDLSFTIDGNNKTYTGTITVNGNRRSTGAETLTIQNIQFVAEGQWQSSIFAKKNTYVHNLIVDGCTFTGTDAKQAYGIRLNHSYNIVVRNTIGTNLYDLVYAQTAVTGFTAENIVVTDSGMGFMMPYANGEATFKNVTLDVSGAGVGIYNNNVGTASFENCSFNANPAVFLIQKNANKRYTVMFNSGNTSTGRWITVGDEPVGEVGQFTISGLELSTGFVNNGDGTYTNCIHNFENDKCTMCGEKDPNAAPQPVIPTVPSVPFIPRMANFVTTTGEFNEMAYFCREARVDDVVTLKVSTSDLGDKYGLNYKNLTVKYETEGAVQVTENYDYNGSTEYKDGIATQFKLAAGSNIIKAKVYYNGIYAGEFAPFYATVK